jgi:hypothetical protein
MLYRVYHELVLKVACIDVCGESLLRHVGSDLSSVQGVLMYARSVCVSVDVG